ncbi:MAG: ABC transporter permease [Clostridia bacterium]|nr:ABC transporter permease [Clostridia bacterium]
MRKSLSWLYLGLVFLFLYAPILIMIILSFNGSHNITVWGGFSLQNYENLLHKQKAIESLWNSLFIALLSSLGSCVLGTLASIGLNNLKKSRSLVMNISNLPIINPEIVTGVSLMLIFSFLFSGTIGLGFHTVLLAHIVFNTPYVILNVMPRLRRMDQNLYEAALDLGCRPVRALWQVVMPELFPAILSGFLISFTYSMDDFIISYYTGGTFQTFSVFIYNSLKKGPQDWMLALSGLLFVAVLSILIIMNVHDIRQEKREARNA